MGIAIYSASKDRLRTDIEKIPATEYVSYKSSEYSPEFTYPKSFGKVTIKEGNKTCPEEYGYRTEESLNVFDWEFSFSEIKLQGSDSMIRTGIRTYELDPKKLNDCGDDFLLKIANKEIVPETLSSFRLISTTNPNGLWGTYNPEASRLNTEARIQYTFFIKQYSGIIYIVQPYTSFIPYFDSPELIEMEQKFAGNMNEYLQDGVTAENIRKHFEEFRKVAESLKVTAE